MGKLAEILAHPNELLPMIRMRQAVKRACKLPDDPALAFCYGMLNDVSRSFAVVIQQLPTSLRDAICVFYLVLRGLDTVEDDMALPDKVKLPVLHSFYTKIYDRDFSMDCGGTKHYKRLMAQFGTVVDVFLRLDKGSQDVIADITRRMGAGMADFIQKDVVTVADYDLYCHYVAGLVGVGLSQLFVSSGLEVPDFARKETLSNHMGLFLQKTNIIRDYLEDIMEEPAPRMFWPQEIWGNYARELAEFKEPHNRQAAVRCLNHMVVDVLQHVPYCMQYMAGLQDVMVFRFCAIPQIMAAGTLALCYNNGKLFEGVVKMRRGETARVFERCSNMGDLFSWCLQFLKDLQHKVEFEVDRDDPTLSQAEETVHACVDLCSQGLAKWAEQEGVDLEQRTSSTVLWIRDYLLLTVVGIYSFFVFNLGSGQVPPFLEWLPQLLASQQQLLLVHRAAAVLLLIVALRLAVLERR